MSASLIGRRGSGAFRLSAAAVSILLTGSCLSSESDIDSNRADVRFGSKADVTLLNFDVRFTPESGHSLTRSGCLLWAISGLNRPGLCCRAVAVAAVAVSNLRRSRLRRCGKLFGSLLVSRAGHGIDNCDGDRHLYVEAGGQKHTQWLAPVSRAASPQIVPPVVEPPHHARLPSRITS
jgi:hypothetical protein